MRSPKRTPLLLLFVFLGVFACAVPGISQIDQYAAGTAVQQTLSAIMQQTQNAGEGIVDLSSETPVPSATSSLTFTPIPPNSTATFPPTATLTPTLSPSWTPTLPMISVSVATNCRLGPGVAYQLMGYLATGQSVRVYARDPGQDYWYIRNPEKPAQFCWVWGEYATVVGSVAGLAIYTPPPTPTPTMTSTPAPGFNASYLGIDNCTSNGAWWSDIKLTNTGTVTFRSVSMTFKDTVTSVVKTAARDGFTDSTGCNLNTVAALFPGQSRRASGPVFGYNPAGHKLNVTVTLCSKTGMNGYCVTQSFTVKKP